MADPATARSSASPNDLATGRQKLLGHLAVLLFAMLIAGSFTLGDLAIVVEVLERPGDWARVLAVARRVEETSFERFDS